MILRSKKGEEGSGFGFSTLAKILLVLAAGIVIFLFIAKAIGSGMFAAGAREVCRTSLLGQGLAMYVDENIVPPKCPTYSVKFFENKVEINGKEIKVIDKAAGKSKKSFDSLNDDIVNQVLAEELRLCWWQFWEGKRKFGSTMALAGWMNDRGDNCFICDEISFDSSIKIDVFTGYYQYLKNTKMPGSQQTYYWYIAENPTGRIYDERMYNSPDDNVWEQFRKGVGGPNVQTLNKWGVREAIIQDINFDKNLTYVIIFDREGQAGSLVAGTVMAKTGISGDTKEQTDLGLDSTMTYFVYIIPKSQLPKVCDSVSRGTIS